MKQQNEWQTYLRDVQSMVPPGRDVEGKAMRRQRMVRLLRELLESERNRGNVASARL